MIDTVVYSDATRQISDTVIIFVNKCVNKSLANRRPYCNNKQNQLIIYVKLTFSMVVFRSKIQLNQTLCYCNCCSTSQTGKCAFSFYILVSSNVDPSSYFRNNSLLEIWWGRLDVSQFTRVVNRIFDKFFVLVISTDEDARQAFLRNDGKIKGIQIKLLLSSRTEMQRVIEQARTQSMAAFMLPTTTPSTTQVQLEILYG